MNETFGAIVAADVPIVVERALYGSTASGAFSLGTNATATPLP